MKLPRNKWLLLAALWFAGGVYSLIFRESGSGAPPFPHFDKFAHFCLFFAQIWLAAKAFMQDKVRIPYKGLWIFALVVSAASEWAQGVFTLTREASVLDAIADMLGATAALWLANRVQEAKAGRLMPSENANKEEQL